jgi:hypothetical protein
VWSTGIGMIRCSSPGRCGTEKAELGAPGVSVPIFQTVRFDLSGGDGEGDGHGDPGLEREESGK